jgi:vacuolar-type H+-ATPase subunit I/STV1
MATSAKALSENVGVLNERSFFVHKAQNPDTLKMRSYISQKNELESAIEQDSAALLVWQEERQAEQTQMDGTTKKLKAKMEAHTFLAVRGRPITVQDLQEVEQFKANIRDSQNYVDECDEKIAICQENILNAQRVLAQVNVAIEKLQSKTNIAVPAKSPNASPMESPRSDVDIHTASNEAHSDPEENNSDSEGMVVTRARTYTR